MVRKVQTFSEKVCVVCQASYRPTGSRQKACKNCKQAFRQQSMPKWLKTHRANDIERSKRYQREYYKKHPEHYSFWQVKGRANRTGIPFNLSKEDIVYPSVCPVLGIPIFRNVGNKSYCGNSPSVDRIDPKGGYVKGNIQIISQRANVMKNDASPEELLKFADWVYKNYKKS